MADEQLRLLMLGTVNHPHVEHLAAPLDARGIEVIVAGDTEPSLPPSVLPSAGFEVRHGPTSPRRTLRGLAQHVRWIRRLLSELRPDVVHAHWLPGFAFFAALAGARPLVAMAWGSDVFRANRRKQLVNRFTVRRADLVMTDSSALLDRLYELGAPRERTRLVSWGVDLRAFSPADRAAARSRLGLGPGPVVLSPRSIAPVYNIPTIVEAFRRVERSFPGAELVLKHMGVDEPDSDALPDRKGVRLVGHVGYEQMADYYRAADVCVSVASSDSAPRSAWESLACGTPLVVSNLPWVGEQLEDGHTALVVDISADAIAAAVERVLGDPALAARLAAEGRALAEREHDRERQMDRLAGMYHELARMRGRQ
jgi:glycosyltransferase involved in cell wall biosynthesis